MVQNQPDELGLSSARVRLIQYLLYETEYNGLNCILNPMEQTVASPPITWDTTATTDLVLSLPTSLSVEVMTTLSFWSTSVLWKKSSTECSHFFLLGKYFPAGEGSTGWGSLS